MNERESQSRGQQFGGQTQGRSRQAGQWQAESPRQMGGLQQDRDDYEDYARARGRMDEPDQDELSDYGRSRSSAQSRETSPRYSRGMHGQHSYDASYGNDYSSFTGEDYGGRDFYAGRGGTAGSMRSSGTYRPSYGVSRWFGDDYYRADRDRQQDYGEWRAYGEQRGFLERAGDEIASWFGDEDAARRRQMDHAGRGPSDYTRSDERIREDANDHLTHDRNVDATNISVSVSNGEVTLNGTVQDRWAKRRAEDVVDSVSGVKHVQNNLRVADHDLLSADKSSTGWSSTESSTAGASGMTEKPH